MKVKICLLTLIIIMATGCAHKETTKIFTNSSDTSGKEEVVEDNLSVNNDQNDKVMNNAKDNELNDSMEGKNTLKNSEEFTESLKNFIGNWKVKALFDEDFFVTEELLYQDNGIGIFKDYLMIYACEVNDYIRCDFIIEEIINDSSIILRIKERKTSSGRNVKDDTKFKLELEEGNHNILKVTDITDINTYCGTYVYEKNQDDLLNQISVNKQKYASIDNDNLKLISEEIQGEWFEDYSNIQENIFLSIDEESKIKSYIIKDNTISSNFYDLKGGLSWKSGNQTFRINSIIDDLIVIEIVKEEGNPNDIVGMYYAIEIKNNIGSIRTYNYLSDNRYRFSQQAVIKDSLERIVNTLSNYNNLYMFSEQQKRLFNKIIRNWGAFKDGYGTYIYNLVVKNYYINFYKNGTGFMEALNFKIRNINVKDKTVLLDVNQYSWWDEINGDTKYLDNQILLQLNEDETKLTFKIIDDQESLVFNMDNYTIEEVVFDKIIE